MQQQTLKTDFLISGGGPVGLILGIALAKAGHSIVVAEAQSEASILQQAEQTENGFDGRVLALSYGSVEFLKSVGIWEDLAAMATIISKVHVSQKGYLGITTISAEEMQVPALGYSVQGWHLGRSLWEQAKRCENLTLLEQTCLTSFLQHSSECKSQTLPAGKAFDSFANYSVTAQLASMIREDAIKTDEIRVFAHCLIGADGTKSQVREGLGIALNRKDYEAFGILSRIESKEHPQGMAFERFTETGPMALLPMQGHFHKAVWVCPKHQKDEILAMDDDAFLEAFSKGMGRRFGGFVSVSERLAYPLQEATLDRISDGCVVLMGNAAHTQHPVAAQGLNLGIADVQQFVTGLASNVNRPVKLDDTAALSEFITLYAKERHAHHQKVMGMTDGLIQLFQHPSPLVGHLRGVGLMAMQAMPFIKKRFSKFAMGARQ